MKTTVNAKTGTKQHAETIERYTEPVIEVLQSVCEAIGWHLDLQKPPDPDDETAGLFAVDKADIGIRCMFAHLGDFFEYNVGVCRKESHFINMGASNTETIDEQWLYQLGYPPINLHWISSSGDSMRGWYRGMSDKHGSIYAYPAIGTMHYITEDQITWIADGVRENFQTLEMRF